MEDKPNKPKAALTQRLEEAYLAYADELFRYAFSRLHDREAALESVQESFTKVWDALYLKEAKVDNIRAYLYRTLHNIVVNLGTRSKRTQSLEELTEMTGFEPEEEAIASPETIAEYREALSLIQSLPAEYADPIAMRYVAGLPIADIAEALGMEGNAVTVRIHRGLKKLKELHQK